MSLWERVTTLRRREIYYYNTREDFRTEKVAIQLHHMIREEMQLQNKRGIVFLCIGTDRSTGDSLGPLVGYKLESNNMRRASVLGTLESPVHAMNLEQHQKLLQKRYPECLVIAIDASVGSVDHVGYVTIGKGALKPGLGVSKELREVGDLHITGIVGSCGNYDPLMLQSIRLSIVMNLADCISESILLVEKLLDCVTAV